MSMSLRRREFLGALAAASLTGLGRARAQAPSDRLNIGVVGTAHRGGDNLQAVSSENIVALCDIDDGLLASAAQRFPGARTYNDFRKLLEQKDLDAVVISTADHTHAPAAAMALRLGKHVYVEKPMAHSVHEARTLTRLAREAGVATQMGIQIHATDNYRRVVEWIRAGAVGTVKEVHVWCGKSWGGGERPTETPTVPSSLHWDLWLGPAPERPYHPVYQPANWRRWWDFGSGTLGDMACHLVDLPFWALELGAPSKVSTEGPPVHPETAPEWLVVHYEFPASNQQEPVRLSWYDGGKTPARLAETGEKPWYMGVLFVGSKGMLMADYDRRKLIGVDGFEPPAASIPDSIGHHREWVEACKDRSKPTTCSFDYSGNMTEAVLLGNVAFRSGQELAWDAASLRATNHPDADRYLRRDYRAGWTL